MSERSASDKATRERWRAKWIPLKMAVVAKAKDVPCADCGGRFPTVCMDFDHLPGFKKLAGVANLTYSLASMDRLLAEIEKCEVVCANCHRLRTKVRRELVFGVASPLQMTA